MKTKFYLKDLSYDLSIQYNLNNNQALKAVQFVFTFILSSLLNNFAVKISSFCNFSLAERKQKQTLLLNSDSMYTVPKRKVLLCKFSKNVKYK